jgi:hypothetical protein
MAGGSVPNPVEDVMWLAGAVLLSWIAIGLLAAALTFVGVAVFPLRSERLWAAAGACFLVACLVGLLILVPVSMLWGQRDEWSLLSDILRVLRRD